jgi:hypothetical protein
LSRIEREKQQTRTKLPGRNHQSCPSCNYRAHTCKEQPISQTPIPPHTSPHHPNPTDSPSDSYKYQKKVSPNPTRNSQNGLDLHPPLCMPVGSSSPAQPEPTHTPPRHGTEEPTLGGSIRSDPAEQTRGGESADPFLARNRQRLCLSVGWECLVITQLQLQLQLQLRPAVLHTQLLCGIALHGMSCQIMTHDPWSMVPVLSRFLLALVLALCCGLLRGEVWSLPPSTVKISPFCRVTLLGPARRPSTSA